MRGSHAVDSCKLTYSKSRAIRARSTRIPCFEFPPIWNDVAGGHSAKMGCLARKGALGDQASSGGTSGLRVSSADFEENGRESNRPCNLRSEEAGVDSANYR